MAIALFDTNILMDYLNGISEADQEIALCQDKAISVITWMEVMVGATEEDTPLIKGFLSLFSLLPINSEVSIEAVKIRKERKIKLPDAIILATARTSRRTLITRNTKDFPSGNDDDVRHPYVIEKSEPR